MFPATKIGEEPDFEALIQADVLTFMMSLLECDGKWIPRLLHYNQYSSSFPFFIRAAQHRNFKKLAVITGISSADELRLKMRSAFEGNQVGRWVDFRFHSDFNELFNLDGLDTIN